MAEPFEVQILGNYFSFNLPEDVDSKDFIEIIYFVEDTINRIRKSAGDLDSYKLALLASINIAEELFTLQKENIQLKGFLNKIDKMVPKIDFINETKKKPVKLIPEQ